MSIIASQLGNIFSTGEPWARNGQQRFQLQLASSLVVTSSILSVASGGITSSHLAPGAVTASALNITSQDVPHSSPSVAATDVKAGLEEVALGYLSRLPKGGGTMTGTIDMDNQKITNVPDPIAGTDAANLQTVTASVSRGDYYFTPTTYGNPTGANGTLKATWIRASASFYSSALPSLGDTITIHGVTFTYVSSVTAPTEILLGGDVPSTIFNTVSTLNASTLITLDLIPFNTNFWSVQEAGIGWAFHVLCINEDPPNTPEDGDDKLASEVSSVITCVPFRGGRNVVKDGLTVFDLYTNTLYTYDQMQPSTPWIPIQGIGGPTNATQVTYTGANLTNIPVVSPDNLQNILVAIDTRFGAGGLPAHAVNHEVGGIDEISVAGLTGLLATPQTPATHASTHESGGADEISVAALSGKLADLQDAGWLQSTAVSASAPSLNDILTYTGGSWAPQPLGSITSPVVLSGLSGTGLAVGDAVYVSTNDTVAKAQASSSATMPAAGVVSKSSPLEVTVVGKITGLSGITAGAIYYVDPTTPGVLTSTPPSTSGHVIQSVALGLNTTTIVVLPITFTQIT